MARGGTGGVVEYVTWHTNDFAEWDGGAGLTVTAMGVRVGGFWVGVNCFWPRFFFVTR